jgi:hypothetical protein
MAKIEPPKGRNEARKGSEKGFGFAREGAKRSPKSKMESYLLEYRKGKYFYINLNLKKKGHQQR